MNFGSFVKGNRKDMCLFFSILVVIYLIPVDELMNTRIKSRVIAPINRVLAHPVVLLLLVLLQAYCLSLDGCTDLFICITLFILVQRQ